MGFNDVVIIVSAGLADFTLNENLPRIGFKFLALLAGAPLLVPNL